MSLRRPSLVLGAAVALAAPLPLAASAAAAPEEEAVRFASYNVSMFRAAEGELAADLADADDEPQDAEVRAVAEVIQRERPDVLLLNEVDHDTGGVALERFTENFLEVAQADDTDPVVYPYAIAFASNTGVASGFDLNGDGAVGTEGRAYGDDALGFGEFPGQYAFAVLSQHPIDAEGVRTFQELLWKDVPGARLPDDPATDAPGDFYSPEELAVFRLSSKNHVDVPVHVGGRVVHVLASHPTPPVFDGPEDRNGLRNADEIRFWDDYVSPGDSRWIVDDEGHRGGLRGDARFVVMGDLNADPAGDGDGVEGAVEQLLDDPRVQDPEPSSEGGAEASALQGGANEGQAGDPALDTADFNDAAGASGNLRADYVLPSTRLRVLDAAVFWPEQADPLSRLTGTFDPAFTNGFPSSDHRLVRVDVALDRR